MYIVFNNNNNNNNNLIFILRKIHVNMIKCASHESKPLNLLKLGSFRTVTEQKSKSKTIQWKKLTNCDVIEDN